jgi:hypothetical protein
VEGVPAAVEVGDDRLDSPVAIAVGDVAAVAGGQQLGVEPRVVGPRPGVWADADGWACLGWGGRGAVLVAHGTRQSTIGGYQASARGGTVGVELAGDRVLLTGRAVTVFRAELAPPAAG